MDNTDDIVQAGDVTIIERNQGFGWFKGTNYNYYGPARYPVPAILCSVHIYHDMVIAVQSPPCCSGYHTKRLATGNNARW